MRSKTQIRGSLIQIYHGFSMITPSFPFWVLHFLNLILTDLAVLYRKISKKNEHRITPSKDGVVTPNEIET